MSRSRTDAALPAERFAGRDARGAAGIAFWIQTPSGQTRFGRMGFLSALLRARSLSARRKEHGKS